MAKKLTFGEKHYPLLWKDVKDKLTVGEKIRLTNNIKKYWKEILDKGEELQISNIFRAFVWSDTPEGYLYWANIYYRIYRKGF